MNEARQPVLRWHAEKRLGEQDRRARASRPSGNEIAMESVELVHEGLTIEAAA
jgi:hypothetical protein